MAPYRQKWCPVITPSKKNESAGFELSFGSAAVKIYPFTILYWVNENENMYPKN